MYSSLELEIRDWLARYLSGEITLSEFRDWFIPATWDVESSGDFGAENFSYDLELLFSEFRSGHRTEQELKTLLMPEVVTYSVHMSNIATGTQGTPVTSRFVAVGKPLAVAHA